MDIDSEHLGIPDTSYDAIVHMSSTEFQRICRDLQQISESVKIEATKEGIKFSGEGEVGNGSITLKQNANVDNVRKRRKVIKRDVYMCVVYANIDVHRRTKLPRLNSSKVLLLHSL